MKRPILLGLTLLAGLGLARPVVASAPADTLKGQAHFTRTMSAGLCTRLTEESQKSDLSKLAPDEAKKLFEKTMYSVMFEHLEEFQTLLEQAPSQAQSVGQQIGKDALFQMLRTCPAASIMTLLGSAYASKAEISMSDQEKQLLKPFAQAACQRLDAVNAATPFKAMTPENRRAAMEKALMAAAYANAPALMKQYGDDVLTDASKAEDIGKKVALLMLPECPAYLAIAGEDSTGEKEAPPVKATVKAKVAPKAPVKKAAPATRKPAVGRK